MIAMNTVSAEEVKLFLLEHLEGRLQELHLNPADLTDDVDLFKQGVLDSMGIIEMISAVEQKFGLTVDFEGLDVNDLTIMGPFCRYVEAAARRG